MKIIIVIYMLLLPGIVYANSINGVSGSLSHGSSLTITGTDFGSKSTAAPLRYDDFESGTTVGHLVSTDVSYWGTHTTGGLGAIISDVHPRTARDTKNVRCMLSTDGSNEALRADTIYKDNIGFNTTGKAYINYWVYMDLAGNAGGTSSAYQVKNMGMGRSPCADCSAGTGGVDWQFSNWANSSPPLDGWYERHHFAANGTGMEEQYSTTNITKETGWYNWSIQIDFGTAGNSNGSWTYYNSRYNQGSSYYKWSYSGQLTPAGDPSPYTLYPDFLRIGWYHGSWYPSDNATYTTYFYYDSVYIDNSWARVEIGDNSTYDNCTYREIQLPTAWSDTSISITGNLGRFTGSNAYLFVVKEDGTVSSGYQITLGGSSDTTAPTITSFTMPSTASSTTVSVTSFTASDAVGVTGYCITTVNNSSGCSWSGSAPTTATGSAGSNTWYAWAKDAAGNISTASTASTTITLPSTATAHVNGHINGSLK